MNDREILLELMFRALIEIRADAAEKKAMKAFKLADLLHNLTKQLLLEMDECVILRELRDRAGLKGVESWLDHASAEITAGAVSKSS